MTRPSGRKRPDRPSYGAGMRSLTLDLGGPVHVADLGGEGRPIVLLHGIDGSHVNFLAVAPGLAAHGHVLAPDLVGFGLTPPAGRTSDLRTNLDVVVRLLATLDRPATVLGTSMGGLLAMLAAGRRPDLVERLVLVGPGQPRPRGVPLSPALALRFVGLSLPVIGDVVARRRYRQGPDATAEQALARVCAHPERVPAAVRAAYVDMARRRARMPWTPTAFRQAARSLVTELRRPRGFPDFVRRLEPSTLLVQGHEDQLVSVAATRRLAALRPDWRYEELEDVGHSPQLEVPDRLVELVGAHLPPAPAARD